MGSTEIYNNFLLRRAGHIDERLKPVSTVNDLLDPNAALSFLYEGATVWVISEQANYQVRKSLSNPSQLAWYKTTKGDLVIGSVKLDHLATNINLNAVVPNIEECYAVRIEIEGGNSATLTTLTNFPDDKDIIFFCEDGKEITVTNTNFLSPVANRIILENGLDLVLKGRANGPDYLTLRKESQVAVQISARQLLDPAELVSLKLPPGEKGEKGDKGDNGVNGTNGINGETGPGYFAFVESLSTSILSNADTEITINIGPGKAYSQNARVRVSYINTITNNFFEGVVNSYDINSGVLNITAIDLKVWDGVTAPVSGTWSVNIAGQKALTAAFDDNFLQIRKKLYGAAHTEPFIFRSAPSDPSFHQAICGGTAASGGNYYFTDFGYYNGSLTGYTPIIAKTGIFSSLTMNETFGTFVVPVTGFYNISLILQIRFAASNLGFSTAPSGSFLRDGNTGLANNRTAWVDAGKTAVLGVGAITIASQGSGAQRRALASASEVITPLTRGISITDSNIAKLEAGQIVAFPYVNTTDSAFWTSPDAGGEFFVSYFEANFIKLD